MERVVVSDPDPVHVHVGLTFNDRLIKLSQFPFFNDQPTQVQAVVVVFGVVGLVGVDDEQSGSPEMSSVACNLGLVRLEFFLFSTS